MGGAELWREHALSTALLLNDLQPDYLALLTLMPEPGTDLFDEYTKGRFSPLDQRGILTETRLLISGLELKKCVFRSNHASNYIAIGGDLPEDKPAVLLMIDKALEGGISSRPDFMRRL